MPSLLAAPTTHRPAEDRPAIARRAVDRPVVECSPVDRPSSPFSDGDWAVALYEVPEH